MEVAKETLLRALLRSSGSPASLATAAGISRSSVQKYLKEFVEEGYVEKVGVTPHVYYKVVENLSLVIQDCFMFKDTVGHVYRGMEGFKRWVEDKYIGKSFEEKIRLFEAGVERYENRKKDGLFEISAGLESLQAYTDIQVDSLRCIDLYAINLDSYTKRTRASVLLEIVKKNADTPRIAPFMQDILDLSVEKIVQYARRNNISCIAFVPPTARRKVQVMKEIEKEVMMKYPQATCLKIKKYNPSGLPQEQKTIRSVQGRIENAEKAFSFDSGEPCDTVLLVDDLVGSAATLNEVARKVKEKGVTDTVHAITVVGVNSKRFPVEKKM